MCSQLLHTLNISKTHFGDHVGLDAACVGDMWTDAKIDHGTASVDSRGCPVWDLVIDDMLLVLIVL